MYQIIISSVKSDWWVLEDCSVVSLYVAQKALCAFFFLTCSCTMSVIFQACHKEHHSDTLYPEDLGSQPCAKVAAQIFGHSTLWSTTQYVIFFFASAIPIHKTNTLTRDEGKGFISITPFWRFIFQMCFSYSTSKISHNLIYFFLVLSKFSVG